MKVSALIQRSPYLIHSLGAADQELYHVRGMLFGKSRIEDLISCLIKRQELRILEHKEMCSEEEWNKRERNNRVT